MLFLTMLAAAAALPADPPPPPAAPAAVVAAPEFQIGRDKIADITAKLGQPNGSFSGSDGSTTIVYASFRSHTKGATFIPIVCLFAGGAKAKAATRTFTFGPDGVLKSYSSSDYQADCGMAHCN